MKLNNMLNRKNIPVAVMLAGNIWYWVVAGIDNNFYISLSCTLMLVLSFGFYNKAYKYLLFTVLVAALFGLVTFFPTDGCLSLGVSRLILKIQIGGLFLVGLTYFLNKESANIFVVDSFQRLFDITPERIQAMNEKRYKDAVSEYKQRYKEHTIEQLKLIVEESRYVPEALEAARQLLNERKGTGEEL